MITVKRAIEAECVGMHGAIFFHLAEKLAAGGPAAIQVAALHENIGFDAVHRAAEGMRYEMSLVPFLAKAFFCAANPAAQTIIVSIAFQGF